MAWGPWLNVPGVEYAVSSDGERLYLLAPMAGPATATQRAMMAADLAVAGPASPPTVVRRSQLFTGDFFGATGMPTRTPATYDIVPDGRRFIMGRLAGGGQSDIVVWTNWLPELQRQLRHE